MNLAPPTIIEELSVCSRHVRLKGQLQGARVDLLIDGSPNPVGGGVADWPDQWFDLDPAVTLHPGQMVRARQSLGADSSALSSVAAMVQDRATSSPQFAAPLVYCTTIAVIEGLSPGATATVSGADGTVLGTATAPGSQAVVPLSRIVIMGEILSATTSACGAPASPWVRSLPAEPMKVTPDGHLLPPRLIGPLLACMRVLHFDQAQVGGRLFVERAGGVTYWDVTSTEVYARIDPPLAGGETLRYWQEAPSERCQAGPSGRLEQAVDAGPPPAPWIVGQPCPGSMSIRLEGLVPSATVKILVDGNDALEFVAAEVGQDVDLGGLALAPGAKLTVVQGLCDVFGPSSAVPASVTQPTVGVIPGIPERLVACAGVVRVDGLAEGSFVQVYSERLKGRIGYAWADGPAVDVLVSPPLLAPLPGGQMDHIRAEISGCTGGAAEREVEGQVDLPPFRVSAPIDGDRSVLVVGLVAGCLVDVVVDDHWAGEAWAATQEAWVAVVDTLRQGQQVEVTARLCGQQRTAAPVTVAAPLKVDWSLPSGMGIEIDADKHMAGRVWATLTLGPGLADHILAGTEEGGLWVLQPGSPAIPLSPSWPAPSVRSLARGTRGANHLYCGTLDGMLETDPSVAVPLLSWTRINGLPGLGGGPLAGPRPGRQIRDILVLPGHNLIAVATEAGVWSSPIPPTTATGYVWSSDPAVNQGSFTALCEGPDESIVAYRNGAPGSAFVVGVWGAGGLQWTVTTPGQAAPPADPRLTTVVARMANGSLASCPADRLRVYAALEDGSDNQWLAVLRSDDGGKTWAIPYDDPNLTHFKKTDGGGVPLGLQADRNLKIGAHPVNHDVVLLVARRTGLLGSTTGGNSWDSNTWPEISDDSFHADSMCIAFEPNDPSGNTIVVGSDGGLFISNNLGQSWDSSCNAQFPTLMFDAQYQSATRALSACSAYPGLLVGALQDNGNVYLRADNEPWRELDGGDGNRALFVTSDIVLRAVNDDLGVKWSRWRAEGGAFGFSDPVQVRPPGYPDKLPFLPILSRVANPSFADPDGGALMVAIGGDDPPTGDVFGFFDKGAAADPPEQRFYWKKLGTVPFEITGLGSLTGRRLLIGTAKAHLYQLDPVTGSVGELSLPGDLGQASIRWVTLAGPSLGFALAESTVLRTTNLVSWSEIAGPPGTSLEVLEVDRALDPVALFAAGGEGAWFSRDLGDSWQATSGLPRHPQANHLEVVQYDAGGRAIHLGTWNWSAWRATLA